MPLLNAQTGETRIGDVHLLLTVDAWMMLEQLTSKSALMLLQEVMSMSVGFREVQAIIFAGSEGWRRRHAPGLPPLTEPRINQLIEDVGLMELLKELAGTVKGSKALGMREGEEVAAEEAAPFGGTGGGSSSAPSAAGSTPSP